MIDDVAVNVTTDVDGHGYEVVMMTMTAVLTIGFIHLLILFI